MAFLLFLLLISTKTLAFRYKTLLEKSRSQFFDGPMTKPFSPRELIAIF